jgi:hypothetical protein
MHAPAGLSVGVGSQGYMSIPPAGNRSYVVALQIHPTPPGYEVANNGRLAYGGSPPRRLAFFSEGGVGTLPPDPLSVSSFCGGRALASLIQHLYPASTSDASQPQKKAIVTVASSGYSWVEWKMEGGKPRTSRTATPSLS